MTSIENGNLVATREEVLQLFDGDVDAIAAWLKAEAEPVPEYLHRWRLPNTGAAFTPTQWFTNTTIAAKRSGLDTIVYTDSDICTYPGAVMEI